MKILQKKNVVLVREAIQDAMTYESYRNLVSENAANETSTGNDQSEALSEYTQLNNARMRRLDKTLRIPETVQTRFENFKGDQIWLVLTESWCGDAAQSIPAIHKLSELNAGIELKIVLRDAHPELMDAFLTNGTRSIPKLIVFDTEQQKVIGDWGPRPSTATQMVQAYKAAHGMLTPAFKMDLQVWYTKDKGVTIFEDLAMLLT